jgi:hypothetical protein
MTDHLLCLASLFAIEARAFSRAYASPMALLAALLMAGLYFTASPGSPLFDEPSRGASAPSPATPPHDTITRPVAIDARPKWVIEIERSPLLPPLEPIASNTRYANGLAARSVILHPGAAPAWLVDFSRGANVELRSYDPASARAALHGGPVHDALGSRAKDIEFRLLPAASGAVASIALRAPSSLRANDLRRARAFQLKIAEIQAERLARAARPLDESKLRFGFELLESVYASERGPESEKLDAPIQAPKDAEPFDAALALNAFWLAVAVGFIAGSNGSSHFDARVDASGMELAARSARPFGASSAAHFLAFLLLPIAYGLASGPAAWALGFAAPAEIVRVCLLSLAGAASFHALEYGHLSLINSTTHRPWLRGVLHYALKGALLLAWSFQSEIEGLLSIDFEGAIHSFGAISFAALLAGFVCLALNARVVGRKNRLPLQARKHAS